MFLAVLRTEMIERQACEESGTTDDPNHAPALLNRVQQRQAVCKACT